MKPTYEELVSQLERSRRLCDEALKSEIAWEMAMMKACGEDGPASVSAKFMELQSQNADMAVQLANAESKCRELAAENGRYSMSAGQADQRMSESRAVRSALGFQEDADDVSPSDLVEKIQSLITEQEMLRSAHPQPLGPIMDLAIDAFNSAEMPETGMLNAFFILRDSIRIEAPATDAFLSEVRAQGVTEYASKRGFSFQHGSIHSHFGNGDVMVGSVTFENGDAGINFAPVREKTGGVGTSYEWTNGKTTEQVDSVFTIASSNAEGLEVIRDKLSEAIAQLRKGVQS